MINLQIKVQEVKGDQFFCKVFKMKMIFTLDEGFLKPIAK